MESDTGTSGLTAGFTWLTASRGSWSTAQFLRGASPTIYVATPAASSLNTLSLSLIA
ncbi:Uncharacterised protein [Mycobacteroides abscessus subsp. abscessus]|nr:Uncharacterised protein [Mycobacteroides abscessus subsp. abscessus]